MAESKDYPVVMPKLGLTMMQAQLLEWAVMEGEYINKGDVLFTLESEKSILEIEAPASGYVHILIQAGETVPVNTKVCLISPEPITAVDNAPSNIAESQEMAVEISQISEINQEKSKGKIGKTTTGIAASPRARLVARQKGIKLENVVGTGPRGMIVTGDLRRTDVLETDLHVLRATPIARRLAKQAGVDLGAIVGTGPHGEITRTDIEKRIGVHNEIAPEIPTVLSEAAVPLSGLRAIISERLSSSWRERPHVTLTMEVNAEQLLSARKQVMDETGSKVSYNSFFILAAARALMEHPNVNISLTEEGIVQHNVINVGLAVDTDRGLVVPVIRNADKKDLLEIENEMQELVERALAGRSLPDDLSGGTFTITNLGAYGIEAFTPIINPPEAAILGIGEVSPKAVVENDQLISQNRVTLSLSHDHRILDGAPAARFLQRIAKLISRPLVLFAL